MQSYQGTRHSTRSLKAKNVKVLRIFFSLFNQHVPFCAFRSAGNNISKDGENFFLGSFGERSAGTHPQFAKVSL